MMILMGSKETPKVRRGEEQVEVTAALPYWVPWGNKIYIHYSVGTTATLTIIIRLRCTRTLTVGGCFCFEDKQERATKKEMKRNSIDLKFDL